MEFPQNSSADLYRQFIRLIQNQSASERVRFNRRMSQVFFWCFLLPVLVSASLLLVVKFGILGPAAKRYVNWLVLLFPVSYSLYFLGAEVLIGIPGVFRRGGVVSSLKYPLEQTQWRESTCQMLEKSISASNEQWQWIISSFRMDLRSMQYRAGYLTVLAGAVLFFILQGFDALDQPLLSQLHEPGQFLRMTDNFFSQVSQLFSLVLFLVLLYLASLQNYRTLLRYLDCAELIRLQKKGLSPHHSNGSSGSRRAS